MISLSKSFEQTIFENMLTEWGTTDMYDKNDKENLPEEHTKNEDLASAVAVMFVTFSSLLLIVMFSFLLSGGF
ncbi:MULTISPECIES: hypothetical protein [unclassified Enterococcus]|jgi:hypothetical protein|uniref:hypothetical protein n=1 Tax=unclassified Enterococcus TaxID=2608891 RepID=UPI003D270197